jgi:hypothetical protein
VAGIVEAAIDANPAAPRINMRFIKIPDVQQTTHRPVLARPNTSYLTRGGAGSNGCPTDFHN